MWCPKANRKQAVEHARACHECNLLTCVREWHGQVYLIVGYDQSDLESNVEACRKACHGPVLAEA